MKRAAVAAAASILVWAPAAHASSANLLRRGISHAEAQHWIKPKDAARYRRDVAWALRDESRLPKLRARVISAQLAQLTTLWDSYTSPRALALFTQLEQNLRYFETHRIPDKRVDVSDAEGVVYRWFPYTGLEFHPLASFSALANAASSHDTAKTRALADALMARAIPRTGRRLIWEYSFPYGGGRPPWASGMAQALAAQALARAGALLGDRNLTVAAARAYDAVPWLLSETSAGPWIRLYGFDREIILNAQLQTIVSLSEYGRTTGNSGATALAQRLTTAAKTFLPRFDTGDWSLYSLGGVHASLGYEQYVTELLARLAAQTLDPFWVDAAQRFKHYLAAPQVVEGTPPPTLYPQPQDGWLDTASIPITLSQRSSVTVAVGGKVLTYRFSRGTHVVRWTPPPTLPPGTYPVTVSAVSYVGRRARVQLAPIVVAWDTAPPQGLTAQLAGAALTWQTTDPGTPSLHLVLQLTDPTGASPPQTLDLGQQPVSGTATVSLPAGTWDATLLATNSAGQTATLDLGMVAGPD
ncbi:MAG TPA: D-glucuronyl C5-epimerase family protein [Gaiellaceae bacterium]|nr:D-glucuronyl C5-epimerase family protein [Gaiellaceae bacterium]